MKALAVLFAFVAISRADVLELKKGERLEGTFKQATEQGGVVIEVAGQVVTIPLNKVKAIHFGGERLFAGKTLPFTAEDALEALRALRSVTSTGISYRDYATRVLDAKVKVDEYLSKQSASDEPIQAAIKTAMFYYEHASQMWNTWISASESARAIEEPILGNINQQLSRYWKNASAEILKAEKSLKGKEESVTKKRAER